MKEGERGESGRKREKNLFKEKKMKERERGKNEKQK